MVAIISPSGTGKTELCKDYVNKYEKKYDGVYYIENAVSLESFIYNLPFIVDNSTEKTKDEIIKDKLNSMIDINGRYLYIIDNCNDYDEKWLRKIIPNRNAKYKLIITGNKEIPLLKEQTYHIPRPSKEDCFSLYEYFDSTKDRDSNLELLFEKLNYNYRLIKMSAVYLFRSKKVSLAEYLMYFSEDSQGQDIDKIAYLFLNATKISKTSLKGKLLAFISLIPCSGMQKYRFIEWCLKSKVAEEQQIRDEMSKLEDEEWISIDENECILISPSISNAIFENLNVSFADEIYTFVNENIIGLIKDTSKKSAEEINSIEPYVQHIYHRIKNQENVPYHFVNQIRNYFIITYRMEETKTLTRLMKKLLNSFWKDHQLNEREIAIYNEGQSYLGLEMFDEACTLFKQSIDGLEKNIIETRKHIAMVSAHYAHALANAGHTDEALEFAQRSIKIREELSPSNVWISYYNYALSLFAAGQLDEADKVCNETIERFKQSVANKNLEKGETKDYQKDTFFSSPMQLLGRIKLKQGDIPKAIECLEAAKELRKQRMDNSFWTAQVYLFLCDAYRAHQDYDKAIECAVEARKIKVRQVKNDNMIKQIAEIDSVIDELQKLQKEVR